MMKSPSGSAWLCGLVGRAMIGLAGMLLLVPPVSAQQSYQAQYQAQYQPQVTQPPSASAVVLRETDPFVVLIDSHNYPDWDSETQAAGDLQAIAGSRATFDVNRAADLLREQRAGLLCDPVCGQRNCAIIAPFRLETVPHLMADLQISDYGDVFACPAPDWNAVRAYIVAWFYARALHSSNESGGACLMCDRMAADAFATMVLVRERGYDDRLVSSVMHARAIAGLYDRPEFFTREAVRVAAERAVELFGASGSWRRNMTPSATAPASLVGFLEPAMVSRLWMPAGVPLENIYLSPVWRILQPRYDAANRLKLKRLLQPPPGSEFIYEVNSSTPGLRGMLDQVRKDDDDLFAEAQRIIAPLVWQQQKLDFVFQAANTSRQFDSMGLYPIDWVRRLDAWQPLPAELQDIRNHLVEAINACSTVRGN